MRAPDGRRLGLRRLAGSVGAIALIAAACSGSTGSAAPSGADKTLEIAYLSFAVANSYDAPMLAAAQAAAATVQSAIDSGDLVLPGDGPAFVTATTIVGPASPAEPEGRASS